jgi:hypothetical protein
MRIQMLDGGEIQRTRRRARRLITQQRALVQELLRLREHLGGSLIVRWAVCGKEGCACHRGDRHGPYYVLSTRSGGKGGYTYIQRPQVARAQGLVRQHRRFQAGLRRLKHVNEELVVVLRRYREATGRRVLRAFAEETSRKAVV